tara:strand:+ start:195 stop:1472 length:1278 start_codon:yes stop_codon:yes gene_type:complete
MKFLRYISIFIVISCGGGSGGSSMNEVQLFPSITSFNSSSTSIYINESISLSWQSNNTSSCVASGDWSGNKNINGSETLTLTEIKNHTFTLSCNGNNNNVNSTISVDVIESSDDIYEIDKESYCRIPNNNSSNYWIDQFNNNTLDPGIYSYQLGNGFFANGTWVAGWGNNEQQYYTGPGTGYAKNYNSNTNTTENAFIEDGFLKIQPIYNNSDPFPDPYCSDKDCQTTWDYTSARIVTSTNKVISPGNEITICFRVPDGTGHWPALWMLPQGFIEGTKTWPQDGEIDLMEARGRIPQAIGSAIHFANSNNSHQYISQEVSVPMNVNFQDKFHSVTFKWNQDSIDIYLDTSNEPFYSEGKSSTPFTNANYPFNETFYLILNVASGGNFDSNNIDSSKYCIDVACSNLSDPDKGRLLIDYIEIKSIN